MNILLTNDDGINAPGLTALIDVFCTDHTLWVIAPENEMSAVSHSITLHKPLRASRLSIEPNITRYAVSGTPADCVKLGILELLPQKPDLVVSGINLGANLGINIHYSGTVAAAIEACFYNVPAMAVSVQSGDLPDFTKLSEFIRILAHKIVQNGLPHHTCLNVNLPNCRFEDIKGVRLSRHSTQSLDEFIDKRVDPRNRSYYWQGCASYNNHESDNVDHKALDQQFISITPLKYDMTHYEFLTEMEKWNLTI